MSKITGISFVKSNSFNSFGDQVRESVNRQQELNESNCVVTVDYKPVFDAERKHIVFTAMITVTE